MTKTAKIIITASVVLLLTSALGAIYLLHTLFPKAPPISVPDSGDIVSAALRAENGASVELTQNGADTLLALLEGSEPTRIMSVNDTPAGVEWSCIEIKTEARAYLYFVYLDGGETYVEMPYTGVYIAEDSLLERIEEHTG